MTGKFGCDAATGAPHLRDSSAAMRTRSLSASAEGGLPSQPRIRVAACSRFSSPAPLRGSRFLSGGKAMAEIAARQMIAAAMSEAFICPPSGRRSAEGSATLLLLPLLDQVGQTSGSKLSSARACRYRCRWCGHKERHQDREQRYCPTCVKRTDGTGKPAKHIRARLLWPKALPLKMRFHDLRHTFATELLRQGVDVHRVQRLMRHSDVRVTTGTYSHLLVEDLRAAVDAHAPKPSVPPPAEPPLA